MEWHDIRDAHSPELDQLAERYKLHPLHIEDCRHRNQNAKIEEAGDYMFVVLKPVELQADGSLTVADLDLFLGKDFLITVQENQCAPVSRLLDAMHAVAPTLRADQLFYRIIDGTVDSYLPTIHAFSERLDQVEDEVIESASPEVLSRIFSTKRCLIELRSVLANMRDVAGHLLRFENSLISPDLRLFFRDVYDHLARNLDTIEIQRDLLTGAMDIYLSSVANRTNRVMKVLTILSTVALPALLISSFFGMNLKGLPFADSPHGTIYASLTIGISTVAVWILLKVLKWV